MRRLDSKTKCPKSVSFAMKALSEARVGNIRIFSGLTSPWTTPHSCNAIKPSATLRQRSSFDLKLSETKCHFFQKLSNELCGASSSSRSGRGILASASSKSQPTPRKLAMLGWSRSGGCVRILSSVMKLLRACEFSFDTLSRGRFTIIVSKGLGPSSKESGCESKVSPVPWRHIRVWLTELVCPRLY